MKKIRRFLTLEDKKNNTIGEKEPKGLFHSLKVKKDICDARYDLTQLQILTADGILPFINYDEAQLFFLDYEILRFNTFEVEFLEEDKTR
jgi:hypothetical protein